MAARYLVSPTARRAHRTITSALHAAAGSRRAAVIEVEPGSYPEALVVRGDVELVCRGAPGSAVVGRTGEPALEASGAVRVVGLAFTGRGGDVVVCAGGTLTVEHSTVQAFDGVSLHARAGSAVTLRDSAIAHGRALFAGAVGLVERCRFTDAADNALAAIEGADVRVVDSRFADSRIHGVRVSGSRVLVSGCELTGTGNSAIAADGAADLTVLGCRITAVHGAGISYAEQSRGLVEDVEVVDAEHGLVTASGANPVVRRGRFTGCRDTGINANSQGLGRFEDCRVVGAGNVAVFSTTGGAPDVRGCHISDGNVGIAVDHARGRFRDVVIRDLTSAAVRLLDEATGAFAGLDVERCPTGLEAIGGGGTKAEVVDSGFRDFSIAAVTVIKQSRITLRRVVGERGVVGCGVGEEGRLLAYDCRMSDMDVGGVVAFGKAVLTVRNLKVVGGGEIGLCGRDSAYLDVTDGEFADATVAGIGLTDTCSGQLVNCSVTGANGVGVMHNGLFQLDVRTALPVKRAPSTPSSDVPTTINNFYGPVFHGPVRDVQLAWNNDNVSQRQSSPFEVGVGVPGRRSEFRGLHAALRDRVGIGGPASALHRAGPGVAQSFRGTSPGHDWVLCAVPDHPPVAVAEPVWEALHVAVLVEDPLGALGLPVADEPSDGVASRVVDGRTGRVALVGGAWGDGRLVRSGDTWTWEPLPSVGSDAPGAVVPWPVRPAFLRVRALARLPWAMRGGREVSAERARLLVAALPGDDLTAALREPLRRRGANPPDAVWAPGPNRNALDAFGCSTTLADADGPVLTGEVLLALPTTAEPAIAACAELRVERPAAPGRLTWPELSRFLAVAWRTATEVLPGLVEPDPRALRWAAPPTVELSLTADRPDAVPLADVVDLASLGDRAGGPPNGLAVTVTAPARLPPADRAAHTRRALVHVLRAAGFPEVADAHVRAAAP
ncbi:right-handed parallel beta-helix repeat-containing protein [Saccharothrix australiensis]|uniref:Parallel beta helix pectate lyase-like protein n=1 Tax=Saccharothrix australiensis TaxID=2072 RepID=A0A495W397_9PSEU|nr:right-handed parallel beta-helix repeat-containing protein [Saccharothrix australiensis]RKT56142.1 parallel beta helix pectate lyase-like protein [Saccharothrix australiensis]